jgi:hypothetical protein
MNRSHWELNNGASALTKTDPTSFTNSGASKCAGLGAGACVVQLWGAQGAAEGDYTMLVWARCVRGSAAAQDNATGVPPLHQHHHRRPVLAQS